MTEEVYLKEEEFFCHFCSGVFRDPFCDSTGNVFGKKCGLDNGVVEIRKIYF